MSSQKFTLKPFKKETKCKLILITGTIDKLIKDCDILTKNQNSSISKVKQFIFSFKLIKRTKKIHSILLINSSNKQTTI